MLPGIAVLAASWALWSQGCTGTCEGAGCDAVYDASLLVVHAGGEDATRGEIGAMDGVLVVEGSSTYGPSWQPMVFGGGVAAGMPGGDAVHGFALLDDEQPQNDVLSLSLGSIAGPVDERFGASLTLVPDMSGDGVPELAVGAPDATIGELGLKSGAVYVYRSGNGLVGKEIGEGDEWGKIVGNADDAYAHLGERVVGCDDLDGDGLGDLVAAAWWEDGGANLAGTLHVITSSALAGSSGEANVTSVATTWRGGSVGERLGQAMLCADLVGVDGVPELVVSAPFATAGAGAGAGVVYALLDPAHQSGSELIEDAAGVRVEGPARQGYFGWDLAVGDFDGSDDGAYEVAVGAPGIDGATGAVYVYEAEEVRSGNAEPSYVFGGEDPSDRFGTTVEVGDLDGDGYDDLIVGAPRANVGTTKLTFASGAVYVFRGSEGFSRWQPKEAAEDADARYARPQAYLQTGDSMAVGDLDDDGDDELVLVMGIEP